MNIFCRERIAFTGIISAILFSAVSLCQAIDEVPIPVFPPNPVTCEILSETVICRQPGRYIAWPTITRAGNGDLLVAFSGDRDWHVCPWGRIYVVRSSDGGKTWSPPAIAADTPLDDRDAGLLTLPNGNIMLTFITSLAFDDPKVERYKPYRDDAAAISVDEKKKWPGSWNRISKDHGKTWGPIHKSPANTPHGPTPLKDGRVLYVRPQVFESADQGKTWTQLAEILRDPATWKSRYAFLSEQHAAEAADGRIVALSRYANKKGQPADIELRQIASTDGGKTWTPPRKTGMMGYPAHVLRLENGWLLAVYSRRIPPMGQRACLSKDNGQTWLVEEEMVLSNAAPQDAGDLGYPSSAQLPDGSIWTVFYQVDEPHGKFPVLMGVHWRLNALTPTAALPASQDPQL
ncbi:MAG TPA: sialidase family protein [Terrimicrobiaceae bacterium]|nr:sialidase family protein [Terrimicrobiaceae bacterium]